MTATAQAMQRINDGMDRGLAIYKTAQEYGLSTQRLSAQLRGRRHKRVQVDVSREWWNQ